MYEYCRVKQKAAFCFLYSKHILPFGFAKQNSVTLCDKSYLVTRIASILNSKGCKIKLLLDLVRKIRVQFTKI